MIKDENWSEQEFETILHAPRDTDEELSVRMHGRNPASIGRIRAYMHNFHTRGNISELPDWMGLKLKANIWICPRCYAKVQRYGFLHDKGWM
jgi:hypothetical protein